MTERNSASGGRNAGEGLGVFAFLFLPFVLSFILCRTMGFSADGRLGSFLIAALFLILLSASSLYGPFCLLLAFALLGCCAAAVFPVTSFFVLTTESRWGSVLVPLPLFISLFCSAYAGLRASGILKYPGRAFASKRIKGFLKVTALQTLILSAGFAASFLIYYYMN